MHVLDASPESFGWMAVKIILGHGVNFIKRTYHAACSLPGNVVAVFGGNTGTVDVQDVMLLSFDSFEGNISKGTVPEIPIVSASYMSLVEPKPAPRRFHTLESHLSSGAGILYGGCFGKDYQCFDDVWVLRHQCRSPLVSWSVPILTGPKPKARWGHTASVVANCMIIVGGRSIKDMMDLHVLTFTDSSLSGGVWNAITESTSPAPCPRRRHTACVYGGKIIIFGGFDGRKFLNDTFSYDLTQITAIDSAQVATSSVLKRVQNEPPSAPSLLQGSLFPPVPPSLKDATKDDEKVSHPASALVCGDGTSLSGLNASETLFVKFFIPYYSILAPNVVKAQLVRIKAGLQGEALVESVKKRLLPIISCYARTEDDIAVLNETFVKRVGVQETMSLLIAGGEVRLRATVRDVYKSLGFVPSQDVKTSSLDLDPLEKTVIHAAIEMGWDKSDLLDVVTGVGYSKEQFFKCCQYLTKGLNKQIELETLLDNIEYASKLSTEEIFGPTNVKVAHNNKMQEASKNRRPSSYQESQQVVALQSKLNVMQDALETALTCCITHDTMVDPVATKAGHVYERIHIVDWLQREGTDPLTRQNTSVNDLVPLRNLKDAAVIWNKLKPS